MKRLSRVIALALSLLLIASLFSGCHGIKNSVGFVIPETFDETKHYTVTFWAKNDTNKTQVKIYEKAVADFEALYPNINVELRLYTDYGKIYNDVITNIATGTTPNVCITYPDHIATYLNGENVMAPLDGLMADEKYGLGGSEVRFDGPSVDEVVPQFLSEGKIGGVQYALPFMRSTEACYVNKTYVETLGYDLPETLTWDFVWEVSEAATKKDANGDYLVNGQKVMLPFIYKSTDNMMIQLLKQTGADYSTDQGEILLFNDDVKDILRTVAQHTASGAFSTFKISGYPGNFLNKGQCIFAVDSTAGATWMGTDAPNLDVSRDSLVAFETAVLPIPQADPEHPYMISQGPSVCVFNKEDPKEVLAAWLFAQYLISNDVQIAYAETEGYVPVTVKAQNDPAYLQYLADEGKDADHYAVKIQAARLLMANTEHTFVTPVFSGSASLRDAAGQLIENTAKSVRRRETVDDAYFTRLFKDVKAMYRLDSTGAAGGGAKAELGPLPGTAKALLGGLCAAWLLIGGYYVILHYKKKKNRRE